MKGSMRAILQGLAPVGLHKVYGEEDGANSTRCKALFIVRWEAAAAEGVKANAAVWGCEESPTKIMYNHVRALQSSQRSAERKRSPSGCAPACLRPSVPPSVVQRWLLHSGSRGQNDTLTLQVDKCVLTTLGEISTGAAGSLPGTRFYLHLLRLAEETLNLLHDLWLPFPNLPPRSLLFRLPSWFSFLLFCVLMFPLADLSRQRPPLSSSDLSWTLGPCVTVTHLYMGEGTRLWLQQTPTDLFWWQSYCSMDTEKEKRM